MTRRVARKIFSASAGGNSRPVFFDIDETFPELREIDHSYEDIRTELLGLLGDQAELPRYHDIDKTQYEISGTVDTDRNWNVFMLYAMGEKPDDNRARCPRTAEALDKIPNLWQAFFSILDAGKSIPAHNGPYSGYLRYHLGLKVPDEKPPSIRVKDTVYTWQEGESVLFDDSWNHEVMNEAEDIRAVLIVDVFRPMPLPLHALNRFIHNVFANDYAKKMVQKAKTHQQEQTAQT